MFHQRMEVSKKVFITGGTGLVGSEVMRQLLASGYQVKALRQPTSDMDLVSDLSSQITWCEGSIFDIPFLESCLTDCEMVVHAAAMVSFHYKNKEKLLKTNVEGTANLVNCCLDLPNIKQFCFVSSIAALGVNTKESDEIDENARWDSSFEHSYYGLTKHLAELEVWRAYQEGLPIVVVSPSLVLSGHSWERSSGKLFNYVRQEKPFYSKGTLNYVDVRDVANAIVLLLKNNIVGERFVLSAGTLTYQQFFEATAKRLDVKPPTFAITPFLAEIAWRLAWLKTLFSKKEPFITKETARTAFRKKFFNGEKITKTLPFNYHRIEETLDWSIEKLKQKGRGK